MERIRGIAEKLLLRVFESHGDSAGYSLSEPEFEKDGYLKWLIEKVKNPHTPTSELDTIFDMVTFRSGDEGRGLAHQIPYNTASYLQHQTLKWFAQNPNSSPYILKATARMGWVDHVLNNPATALMGLEDATFFQEVLKSVAPDDLDWASQQKLAHLLGGWLGALTLQGLHLVFYRNGWMYLRGGLLHPSLRDWLNEYAMRANSLEQFLQATDEYKKKELPSWAHDIVF